jgi:hypothetical protein
MLAFEKHIETRGREAARFRNDTDQCCGSARVSHNVQQRVVQTADVLQAIGGGLFPQHLVMFDMFPALCRCCEPTARQLQNTIALRIDIQVTGVSFLRMGVE